MANREIDDVYHRINAKDSYKNRKFAGKKTITDDYTGDTIYYGNKSDAKKLHSLEKTADIDHITPIDKVKERYSDLSVEQQKKLANNENYNYAITNSKLNRNDKNALENHEYIEKQVGNIVENFKNGEVSKAIEKTKALSKQSTRMLGAEVKSRTGMAIEATGMRMENTVVKIDPNIKDSINKLKNTAIKDRQNFTEGAKQSIAASAVPLTVEAVRRLCKVTNGEEDLSNVVVDTAKDFGQIAIVGGAKNIAIDSVSVVLKKAGKEKLDMLLKSNEAAKIIAVTMVVKDSVVKYINGEIDGKEFLDEVEEQGAVMIAGSIGAIAGRLLIPIPVVGEMIGSFIVSTVCVKLYKRYNNLKQQYKNIEAYKKRESEVNKLCSEALAEIRNQQDKLKELINNKYKQLDEVVNQSFKYIYDGTVNNEVELIAEGIEKMLQIFAGHVKFKTYEEFDEFFMNEQCELKL